MLRLSSRLWSGVCLQESWRLLPKALSSACVRPRLVAHRLLGHPALAACVPSPEGQAGDQYRHPPRYVCPWRRTGRSTRFPGSAALAHQRLRSEDGGGRFRRRRGSGIGEYRWNGGHGCRGGLYWIASGISLEGNTAPSPLTRIIGSRRGSHAAKLLILKRWRRDRDSNPGYPFEYAAFPRRYIQPLCHLSGLGRTLPQCPCVK